ncbi:MBL fold metallo-hydrolase [Pseudohoeflea coraliihabitans]|uniref:MBL fold metallo-hydrolase n=1 Tax=Pseudohoeflea coraliihabitans TaxID=2860393 RepID=A0ABS6WML5_9HYPH|nr:MBL fold metallo-hydrolase [Pseudohoeflea sp. DP4N28-3]MBW3097135.1 MBL fold metallo-hydrolase [Pseudohoeflea sp. DP4N28-3]
MTLTRRHLIHSAAAGATLVLLPWQARADNHAAAATDTFETGAGDISVHPISHASFVMETPLGVIHVDPVGEPAQYADLPAPDLILITHEHGDHYNADTLAALVGDKTEIIANPAVHAMLPQTLKERARLVSNGENILFGGMQIEAIPAYNITEERQKFHPEGRDNGYVLNFDGFRVYISGDTENTPEMKALQDIDLAFLCMNLPFTMDVKQAADAVSAFKPKYVYPYHYRGRDGGTQDPAEFAELVSDEIEVRMGDWYG